MGLNDNLILELIFDIEQSLGKPVESIDELSDEIECWHCGTISQVILTNHLSAFLNQIYIDMRRKH